MYHYSELLNGLAEMLKHGLVWDAAAWNAIGEAPLHDIDALKPLVERSAAIKAEVVKADPRESSLRKVLNFGHTIGHGIEAHSWESPQRMLLHGEAVAIGMVCEAWLSWRMDLLSREDYDAIATRLLALYKPYQFDSADNHRLIELMRNDKKNASGQFRFTLLSAIGKAKVDVHVTAAQVQEALEYYRLLVRGSSQIDLDFLCRPCHPSPSRVHPRPSAPTISLPRSKSISNRALLMASLCGDLDLVSGLSDGDDTRVMRELLAANPRVMDCGAGGTTFRFLLAWAAVREGEEHVLTGIPRLLERPHDDLVHALKKPGADIERVADGYRVRGRALQGGEVHFDSPISSQYVSALLFIAPCIQQGLTLRWTGTRLSEPFVHMTLKTAPYQ